MPGDGTEQAVMDWRLGTMGFSYPDWAGVFYPRGVKAGEYLSYYARWFDTVELDTTFHAMPEVERVKKWAAAVPGGFSFAVKTPRLVTHDVVIDRATGAMMKFIEVARHFGDKLGPVLLQFGPTFSARESSKLDRFLKELPPDVKVAVEFRHTSWDSMETEEMLRERRVCWAATHYVVAPMGLRVTTDWLYLRWIGQHDRFETHLREEIDVTPHLDWWRAEVAQAREKVKTAWGYFNNDYSGYSVATCERFKRMVGVEVKERVREPEGPGLFG